MYSDGSNFHIRWRYLSIRPDLNGLHLYGPLLRATLELDKYGRFTTYSSRLSEYDHASDIPLLDGIGVFCLLIAEWDTKQGFDLGTGPPCWGGLILVPKEGEASTYERVGVWLPYGATGCRLQLRNHSG